MADATLTAAPVTAHERFYSVDVMRGFALLGILVMNIPTFASSYFSFMNPMLSADFQGLNQALWAWCHLFFDLKMMAIFSMLFGAGMVLMTDRAESRGASAAAIYYRRVGWLILFGLLHAYLLWYGDILFTYGICGLLIYPLRKLPVVWLIVLGVLVMSIAIPINVLFGFMFDWLRDHEPGVFAKIAAGFSPPPEVIQGEVAAMTGTYSQFFTYNAELSFGMQTVLLIIWSFWRCLGLMLLGMGLMKAGVFTVKRSTSFYAVLAVSGFGLGLPIVAIGAVRLIESQFDFIELFKINWHINYIASVLVAFGWIGFIGLIVRSGACRALTNRLAAVGRMALTNYLMHTVICATLFYGWGFGWWGTVNRAQLLLIVLAIWAFQLTISPIWLRYFRFGPMEWIWRSLTYWKPQPLFNTSR